MNRLRIMLDNGRTIEANEGVWILAILHTLSDKQLTQVCAFAQQENLRQGNGLALPNGGAGIIVP
jgi:hypothetical protein